MCGSDGAVNRGLIELQIATYVLVCCSVSVWN
jgi:hypothetical protein